MKFTSITYSLTAVSPKYTIPCGTTGRHMDSFFLEFEPWFHHINVKLATASKRRPEFIVDPPDCWICLWLEGEAWESELLDAFANSSDNPNIIWRKSYALAVKPKIAGSAGKKVPTELFTRQNDKLGRDLQFSHERRHQNHDFIESLSEYYA
jgi:hypothetical protein